MFKYLIYVSLRLYKMLFFWEYYDSVKYSYHLNAGYWHNVQSFYELVDNIFFSYGICLVESKLNNFVCVNNMTNQNNSLHKMYEKCCLYVYMLISSTPTDNKAYVNTPSTN